MIIIIDLDDINIKIVMFFFFDDITNEFNIFDCPEYNE